MMLVREGTRQGREQFSLTLICTPKDYTPPVAIITMAMDAGWVSLLTVVI